MFFASGGATRCISRPKRFVPAGHCRCPVVLEVPVLPVQGGVNRYVTLPDEVKFLLKIGVIYAVSGGTPMNDFKCQL